jgi:KipI family sensor histidine kinase inhibitor
VNARPRVAAPRLLPLGDAGLVVQYGGDEISEAANAAVLALGRAVESRPPDGVVEVVPTYRSLLIVYDPLRTTAAQIRRTVEEIATHADPADLSPGRPIAIPVAYGGTLGPDLAAVAQEAGLSEPEVIALHSGEEYRVFMLGFTPGFPYMGTLPPRLRVARLSSPRIRVPGRSVAIAGLQTGVYPIESPGGWRLIGRTPLRIYDPSRSNPFLLEAGNRVRFVPISEAEFERDPGDAGASPPRASPRPALLVESGGLLTTVQDTGRGGRRRFGLPQSGAMDSLALGVTNLLIGNGPGAAALEFTFPGPRLRAVRSVAVALGGADHAPTVNGRAAGMWTAQRLEAGDVLAFGAPRAGNWGYLALPGGVDVPEVMASRATYLPARLGGHGGRRLEAGDRIGCARTAPASMLHLPERLRPSLGACEVRVVLGPQEDYFTEEAVRALVEEPFQVSREFDRAGYRLDGPRLAHRARAELLSDGLLPGALQVPSGGQPIVIMPDGPSTGGYPKIGAVVRPDLRRVAQARRGETIRFRAVDWDASHAAAREEAAYLAALRFERVTG